MKEREIIASNKGPIALSLEAPFIRVDQSASETLINWPSEPSVRKGQSPQSHSLIEQARDRVGDSFTKGHTAVQCQRTDLCERRGPGKVREAGYLCSDPKTFC